MDLKKSEHIIRQEIAGSYFITSYNLDSGQDGPHVHIQSGMHGSEQQGHLVIYKLIKMLQEIPFVGTITMIPFANPLSINNRGISCTNGRFNPENGNDYNRQYLDIMKSLKLDPFIKANLKNSIYKIKDNFKKELYKTISNYKKDSIKRGLCYDKSLSLFLQLKACNADIVLDLHTGAYSTRYLYSAEYQKESAMAFNLPGNIIIPNEFAGAMDEACFNPWHKLFERLKKHKVEIEDKFEAHTIELGSSECINSSQAQLDVNCILNYLQYKKVIDSEYKINSPKKPQYYSDLKNYCHYYSDFPGLVEYEIAPGDLVKKGQILAKIFTLNNWESNPFKEVYAHSDAMVLNISKTASKAQGSWLFSLLENYKIN